MDTETLPLDIEIQDNPIIKVMGIGGGGCNAVNYMFKQNVGDVSFMVCNTDKQALVNSDIPTKLQLGPGLGAGGRPEKAQELAEQNREKIKEALNDGTKMLFITAGMGGGTGTGASPVIAQVAKEMEILTVGIVTIPFAFEGQPKIKKAMKGLAKLADCVDAILIINNEKLKKICPDLDIFSAFSKSDDVVCNAAKSIAEIITHHGYINTDFQDVYNTMKDGKVAIMNIGLASGENRITKAIENALESPLANTNDVTGAKRILLQFYCSREHAIKAQEIDQIESFTKEVGAQVEVQWGISVDESLGEDVRVTLIATGYEVNNIPSLTDVADRLSVEDAISVNYPTEDGNKEDEVKVTLDLTTVVQPKPQNQHVPSGPAKPNTPTADTTQEINFVFDEDEDDTLRQETDKPKEEKKSVGLPGWLRGRRK